MKQWTDDEVKPQFSDHLRHASKQTHSISDALVNTRLITILIDRKLYARALGCFYLIFETLENKLSLIQSSGVEPRTFLCFRTWLDIDQCVFMNKFGHIWA